MSDSANIFVGQRKYICQTKSFWHSVSLHSLQKFICFKYIGLFIQHKYISQTKSFLTEYLSTELEQIFLFWMYLSLRTAASTNIFVKQRNFCSRDLTNIFFVAFQKLRSQIVPHHSSQTSLSNKANICVALCCLYSNKYGNRYIKRSNV